MKTMETTALVSCIREQTDILSKNGVETSPAPEKARADWKNDLQIC